MAKRRRKKSKGSAQSSAALRLNGLRAFQSNDYDRAIATWERIPANYRPMPALAEAYFRRGVAHFYGLEFPQQADLENLQKASEIQPENPGYTYHLGLAAHHLGDLTLAVQSYQLTRQMEGPYVERAAYPLALALFQQEQDPEADPVWVDLSPDEQIMIRDAAAFYRHPYQLSPQAPQLWHALAALDTGDLTAAQAGLDAQPTDAQAEQGIRHYYRGVLSVHSENWETARREWLAAYSSGLRSQRLNDNLAEIFHRAAENFMTDGDYQTALAAAQEAGRHKADDKALNGLLAQIYQHLGHQAALASQWDQAQSHWQTAVELDRSSFRLAYNLALIHERKEDYLAAGETWREALRRRPRRADHPDAITDEQIARLWRRAAEAYLKAGQFDEANRVYQQAIKWSPENLDVRLAVADGLLLEGRIQAAQNELDRILDRNPDYVPALLRMGEVLFRSDSWWVRDGAPRYWEHALKLEPSNHQVRQALAEWYIDQAEIDYSWDRFAEAIEDYQNALKYKPRDARLLSCLTNCCIHLDALDKAQEYIDQAFEHASDDLDMLNEILNGWIATGKLEQSWETMERFEAQNSTIPGLFYLVQGIKCLDEDDRDGALPWLERAVLNAAPDEMILYLIGEKLVYYDDELAREYLEKAIAADQFLGQSHLMLARIEDNLGNTKESKKHLNEAARIARKTRDTELADKVEMARMMSGGPHAFMERLMEMGDPSLVNDFLNDFSQFGEDEFYDF